MKEKQNDLFTIGIIAVILLVVSVADLFAGFGEKSQGNSHIWEGIRMADLADSNFYERVEESVEEGFFRKRKWTAVKKQIDRIAGQKEIEGICFGKKGTYLEHHLPEDYPETTMSESLAYIEGLTQRYDARVMLVPTADCIWESRLPAYAESFDQKAYLERVKMYAGQRYVDVLSVLLAHAEEELYYHTDPHLTMLAASYAYGAWWDGSGKRYPYFYRTEDFRRVPANFVGVYRTRIGREMKPESMYVIEDRLDKYVTVCYDGGKIKEGYYRAEYLTDEDPYAYYLGKDFGIACVDTGFLRRESLIILGDSYANVLVPLFAPYYRTIYLINTAEYEGDIEAFLQEQTEQEKTEVLILQSVTGYLENFRK